MPDLERAPLDDAGPSLSSPDSGDIVADSLLSPTYQGYDSLYGAIAINPEVDVRQRFLELRAIRAHCFEAKLRESERKRNAFKADARSGKKDMRSEETQSEWDRLNEELFINLDKCSTYLAFFFASGLIRLLGRALEQDSYAAKAPIPNEYFMREAFRPALESHTGTRAPNGELKSIYGRPGEPMPHNLTTPRGCQDDLVRRLVTLKLMIPLYHNVFGPLQNLFNRWSGREGDQSSPALGGHMLEVITSGVECTWAAVSILIVVTVVYNLGSLTARLIATGVATILVLFSLPYLSDQAIRNFTLAVAYVRLCSPWRILRPPM
jgi:hypothetical protein